MKSTEGVIGVGMLFRNDTMILFALWSECEMAGFSLRVEGIIRIPIPLITILNSDLGIRNHDRHMVASCGSIM